MGKREDNRIEISESENVELIKRATGGNVLALSFSAGGRTWLELDKDGEIISTWALPIIAELRGIVVGVTVLPYPEEMELGKRFPLPDFKVTCKNCDKEVLLEGCTTDYPRLGKPIEVSGSCPECTAENFIKVVLNVSVVAVR